MAQHALLIYCHGKHIIGTFNAKFIYLYAVFAIDPLWIVFFLYL